MQGRQQGKESERIAWHPAFYEAIQMDLADYGDALTYEFERQLTAEPLKMDVLIIKKVQDVGVTKNIAAIFRGHNIVEYKSPGDYVSVADFYKVYGYACLYASLEKVPMTDISVSFMETKHPRDLLKHLREVRGYEVTEKWPGIYHVSGDILPIQIIERKRLAVGENLWLRHLGDDLDARSMNAVLEASAQQGKDARIKAYIDVITQANTAILREVLKMGSAAARDQVLEEAGLTQKWEARGEARGEVRRMHKDAQNALREGLSVDVVHRITGLDMDTIRSLR
jgi:hypothetical protein